jgi:hypothetical protein
MGRICNTKRCDIKILANQSDTLDPLSSIRTIGSARGTLREFLGHSCLPPHIGDDMRRLAGAVKDAPPQCTSGI